jgi:hypothetical protein
MPTSRKLASIRKYTLATTALVASLLIAPAAAQAGPLVASAPDCAEESHSQPFAPWLDPAQYQFAPDGGFEQGAGGWSLDGASVVNGNESYDVHGSGESKSLSLAAGSSATTPTVCVGIEHPTLRFFEKRSSGFATSVRVEVLFETASGNVVSVPIGSAGGTSSWQPTAPMVIVANLLPLLPGDHTPVAFRFEAHGGTVQIDDVYVDPYHRS